MLSYEVSGIAVNGIVHGDFSDWMCADNGRQSLRLDAGVWLIRRGRIMSVCATESFAVSEYPMRTSRQMRTGCT